MILIIDSHKFAAYVNFQLYLVEDRKIKWITIRMKEEERKQDKRKNIILIPTGDWLLALLSPLIGRIK